MIGKLAYDEIIELASIVFTSDEYSEEEKKEFYQEICKMYELNN